MNEVSISHDFVLYLPDFLLLIDYVLCKDILAGGSVYRVVRGREPCRRRVEAVY